MKWKGIEWRRIPEYPKYFISRQGEVINAGRKNGRISKIAICKNGRGYNHVGLYCKNNALKVHKKTCLLHQLVLTTYIGPCPAGMQARHLDGNPENNNLINLAWGTSKENAQDRERHGRTRRGDSHGNAILCERDIHNILKEYTSKSAQTISCEYGVSLVAIKHIVQGRLWRHITAPCGKKIIWSKARGGLSHGK